MSRKYLQSAMVLTLVIVFLMGCTGTSQPAGISLPPGTPQPQMGTIQIVNDHVRGSDAFPGGKNLPDAREYGVCIIAYPAGNPAGLVKPTSDMILAKDAQKTTYGLPAGTYTLQEWQFDSEINQDPLYLPAMKTYVRPTEIVVLKADATIVFGSERTLAAPGAFVEGNPVNPNCGGGWQQPVELPTITPTIANEVEFFGVKSDGGAYNGATVPTTFTINEAWLVTAITTYHWNDGEGTTAPGTIGLKDANGEVYGPWQASGAPGVGGVPNAYWTVNPGIVIPAGTYTVIDSDPATWAQNDETGGRGMGWGMGVRQNTP